MCRTSSVVELIGSLNLRVMSIVLRLKSNEMMTGEVSSSTTSDTASGLLDDIPITSLPAISVTVPSGKYT